MIADDAGPAVVIVLLAWSVVVVITADDRGPPRWQRPSASGRCPGVVVVITALDVSRPS